MMELKLIDEQGKSTASMAASDAAFGRAYSESLIHQVVTACLANARQGTRAQKDRGAVKHSTKKPWRQKGTGRARAGMTSSPLWRGGGVTFGPRRNQVTKKQLPKQMRLKALSVALSEKARDGELAVLDQLELEEAKMCRLRKTSRSIRIELREDEWAFFGPRNLTSYLKLGISSVKVSLDNNSSKEFNLASRGTFLLIIRFNLIFIVVDFINLS